MLLTIGIPVYNGQKYIRETLESIKRCNLNPSEVEIIICDNASTDHTVKIAKEYTGMKVIEHDENVGFDGNLDRIFRYARGKYVWALGADDVIIDNKISDCISILKDSVTYGVIFVGGLDLLEEPYMTFTNPEEFLVFSNFRSGFFPNNIFNRELWLGCETAEFLTTAWIHYAVLLQAIRKLPSVITKQQHVMENPDSNEIKAWNSNGGGLLVGLKLVEIFQVMPQWGYTKKFVKQIKGVIKNAYPREIIVSKIRGLKVSRALLDKLIRLFNDFPSFWLIDFWFLILPSPIYRLAARALKLLKYGA